MALNLGAEAALVVVRHPVAVLLSVLFAAPLESEMISFWFGPHQTTNLEGSQLAVEVRLQHIVHTLSIDVATGLPADSRTSGRWRGPTGTGRPSTASTPSGSSRSPCLSGTLQLPPETIMIDFLMYQTQKPVRVPPETIALSSLLDQTQ